MRSCPVAPCTPGGPVSPIGPATPAVIHTSVLFVRHVQYENVQFLQISQAVLMHYYY